MAEILFIEYPKCSTCQNAKKWLETKKVTFTSRHIVNDTPAFTELKHWYELSGKPLKSFFNTSGLVYKSLALKTKLPNMTEEEQLKLLASNGMLIKRPLLAGSDFVLIGFNPVEWETQLLNV